MKKKIILMALTALMAAGANAQDKNEDIRGEACNDCCALHSISLPFNPQRKTSTPPPPSGLCVR